MTRALKPWGCGYEDEQPSPAELRDAAAFLSGHLGFGLVVPDQPVPLNESARSIRPAR